MSTRWTAAEIAALESTETYQEFARATGDSRSFHAWEVKRRRYVPLDRPGLRHRLARFFFRGRSG